MEYCHPGSLSVKKFKTVPSAKRVMLTLFWDARGVLYMEFLTKRIDGEFRQVLCNLTITQATHLQNQAGKKHISFASRQHKATLQCTNSRRCDKPEIHTGATPSFQSRFGTIRLLVVPKIEEDTKRSTSLIRCRS